MLKDRSSPAGKKRKAVRLRPAAALLLLATAASLPAHAAAEALKCESCDVPTPRALSFCEDMVVFSACLPPAMTWKSMVRQHACFHYGLRNGYSVTFLYVPGRRG